MDGKKHDSGKPDWSLLPFEAVTLVVKVLTFGKRKYGRGNWQLVPDAKNRYLAAALRHIAARQRGQRLDKDSKLPHTAHAICCLLFHLWFEIYECHFPERKTTLNKNNKQTGRNRKELPTSQKFY